VKNATAAAKKNILLVRAKDRGDFTMEIIDMRGDYHWLAGLVAVAVIALGIFIAQSKNRKGGE